jgi:hypothetical protein
MEEDRIGIRELEKTLALAMIEDERRLAPGVSVVGRDRSQDVPHVGLPGDSGAIGDDEMVRLPLREVGLPEEGCPGVLLDPPEDADLSDIAGVILVRLGRDEPQKTEEEDGE